MHFARSPFTCSCKSVCVCWGRGGGLHDFKFSTFVAHFLSDTLASMAVKGLIGYNNNNNNNNNNNDNDNNDDNDADDGDGTGADDVGDDDAGDAAVEDCRAKDSSWCRLGKTDWSNQWYINRCPHTCRLCGN